MRLKYLKIHTAITIVVLLITNAKFSIEYLRVTPYRSDEIQSL